MEYTIIVTGQVGHTVDNIRSAMGEHVKGGHALCIFNLSKRADAYRQMSVLLAAAAGRETRRSVFSSTQARMTSRTS